MEITQAMYLGMAVLMVIPIVMVVLSLTLPYKANRRASIVVAIFFFGFNLIGLPTYPSAYDQFLIVVGLVFNGLTVWIAWRWSEPAALKLQSARLGVEGLSDGAT